VITGTGPNQLVLLASEQWYNADAQFSVTIDGVQQGGIFTTIANHGRREIQDFVFNGTYAPGVHTVAVTFLNDNAGPTKWLDLNLYVNSATIDGQAIPNSTLTEMSNGTQSFTFTVPSPAP